ncbi:UNVERIFIED_CONTAM: hypothetical protein GTU68_028533 [Idotea baltica]|nr:hypothetical protein [Idotea baltica]
MNDRSREVFRRVVEGYLANGDPVGSRTLTRDFSEKVSAATIRNVMQDLDHLGLLDSPHISAGRIPTQLGLRMFVDGLLEVGNPDDNDRAQIDATMGQNENDVSGVLDRLGTALSGVTHGASLVLAPKHEAPIKHIEFVSLSHDRALAVLVFSDGHVENRLFAPPAGQTPSSMREAANFLNSLVEGKTLSELQRTIKTEMSKRRHRKLNFLRSLELGSKRLVCISGTVAEGHPGRVTSLPWVRYAIFAYPTSGRSARFGNQRSRSLVVMTLFGNAY